MKEIILKELNELYKNDQLIIFVGAGVSINSEFPTWDNLTNKIVQMMGLEVKKSYSFEDHVSYAQYFYNKNSKEYYKLLKEIFEVKRESSDLHRKIMDLNQSDVITTNYDSLLEESGSYTIPQYDVIQDDIGLLKSQSRKRIIKMHGDINKENTIVLKEDDYLNFKENKKAINNYLNHLFFSKSILFIGYNINDANVKQILNDIFNYGEKISKKKESNIKHYFAVHGKSEGTQKEFNERKKAFENKNVITIETNDFSNSDYSSNLKSPIGISAYNFLCEIESYSVNKSSKIITENEIIEGFKRLRHQKYVSTLDILCVLEIEEKNEFKKSTSQNIIMIDFEMFDILKRLYLENNYLVNKVFNKTLICTISLYDKINAKTIDIFKIKNADKRSRKIFNNLLNERVRNIHIDDSKYKSVLKSQMIYFDGLYDYYNQKDSSNNKYNALRMQLNYILANHLSLTDDSSIHLEIKEKITLLKKSLGHYEKNHYSTLFNIANYDSANINKHYRELFERIKKETSRTSGTAMSKRDYYGELDKLSQELYIYPMLNGIATFLFKGEYSAIIEDCALAYLLPFNSKYRNMNFKSDMFSKGNKLFENPCLELPVIIMISDLIYNKNLLRIIKKNDIKTINVNFNVKEIIHFFSDFLNKRGTNNNYIRIICTSNFLRNLFTFCELIDNDFAIKMNNIIENDLILENIFKICFQEIHLVNLNLNKKLYNKLFEYCKTSDSIQIEKFGTIMYSHSYLLSNENKLYILKLLEKIKLSSKLPEWIFCYSKFIEKKYVISKIDITKINFYDLVRLIHSGFVNIDEFTCSILIKNRPKKGLGDNAWYYNILEMSNCISTNSLKHIWSLFIDNSNMFSENVIHNIVNYGSLKIDDHTINQYEAKLIVKFAKIPLLNSKINFDLISEELKTLEEKGLLEQSGAYLLGAINYFK